MNDKKEIILAAKCAPCEETLSYIERSGIKAVELYLSKKCFKDALGVMCLCKKFPFRYAVHAPNDEFDLSKLFQLTKEIDAEALIFHNIYWEDEWEGIIQTFKHVKTKLCIENVYSCHEAVKFMRRYGIGRCLDLEHVQLECMGVYEEAFLPIMKEASHVHMTGYTINSDLWHTHIHHSPEHGRYMLGLLDKVGYSGFVVSEAKKSLQSYEEFKKLNDFFCEWKSNT